MRPAFFLLVLCAVSFLARAETGRTALTPKSGNPDRLTGFTLLAPASTGIAFTNVLSADRAAQNQILLNGSGVAAGDVDGDGQCDLYFCSLTGENKLYRNLGQFRFADVSAEAGVACPGQISTGAAFADVDGDGVLDLLVNSLGGGTRLFLNDGHGRFTERTTSGFQRSGGSMSLAIADVDGDGDLDVYVTNYRAETIRSTGFPTLNVNGKRMLPPEYRERLEITRDGMVLEHGEPDVLYFNNGHGYFTPVSWGGGQFLDESGNALTSAPKDWGLSAMFYDVNGDSAPDLYVCNDFQSPDRFWLNDGKGKFLAASASALRCTPTFSMSVDFADVNRDGNVDFLAVDMLETAARERLCQLSGGEPSTIGALDSRVQIERNTLQLGRGDGSFAELAHYAGVEGTGWSWSVLFLDIDLDGYEDLLMTRGNLFNTQDRDANERVERGGPYSRPMIPKKLLMYPPHLQSQAAFRNSGCLRFEEATEKWGLDQVGVAQGICLADLDNDGDLDVIVNNLNGPAGIYRNDSVAPRLAVRLKGANGNTRGIGAKIEVLNGAVAKQTQEMIAGGRYLSGDDSVRTFAAGSIEKTMRVNVTWRNGKRTVLENALPNSIYTLAEADANDVPISAPKPSRPLFEDASALLGHQHHEEAFDDFARQALLPKKFSQLGPGISWIDLNGDGRDELIVASGRGGTLAVFENRGTNFVRSDALSLGQRTPRDQTTILPAPGANAPLSLLAGLSNYEDASTNGAAVQEFKISEGKADVIFSAHGSSTGPLALADIDGDGQLELFVGGRIVPARYPEPASSYILRQTNGRWLVDEKNSALLTEVGLVSGALWTDLNGDGYPELVLACEWGPVKIFANEKGLLREVTRAWGVDQKIGWWNGVAAGDLDGDGRMDLAVSNWGLNSRYHVRNEHGPRIYYAPWGGAGEIEPIEAAFDPETQQWLPERDLNAVGRAIPFIREKFQTHRAYAEAGIEKILGERLKDARVLEANWLETTVFLNRGDHFEIGKLPLAAQFTPAFGVNVADFDGDGHEDIYLSQNFFAVEPQASRNDAGRGLLLKGDGHGAFTRVDGAESGIKVYGEQRGSAAADYDGDGRVDLAVSQNGAATVLYHNVAAKPGLRVRLKGFAGNPQAMGAVLRLRFQDRWGPARELHGGSGYCSVDSPIQVLATPETPRGIEVIWPGGKRVNLDLPAAVNGILVDQATGKLSVTR